MKRLCHCCEVCAIVGAHANEGWLQEGVIAGKGVKERAMAKIAGYNDMMTWQKR